MFKYLFKVFILQFLFFLPLQACSQLDSSTVLTADTLWQVHIKAGMPIDNDPSNDYLILRPQYVLSYCSEKNTANWVAWQLSSEWFGEVPRFKGSFINDTLLPDTFSKVRHSNYTNSGYDRGHMVRSEERTATFEDNKSTFYLTNVLPQTPDLNRGVWLDFEYYCENLCKNENKTLYIFAGGVFHSDSTLKGEGMIAVPDSCFKIVLVLDNSNDINNVSRKTTIIAVLMPNIQGIRREQWESYTTTVRHIEQSTGYDFFNSWEDALEEYLETKKYR